MKPVLTVLTAVALLDPGKMRCSLWLAEPEGGTADCSDEADQVSASGTVGTDGGHGGSQKRAPALRSAVRGLHCKLHDTQRQGQQPQQEERAPTDSGSSAMDSMAARMDAAMTHVEPRQPLNSSIHQKSVLTQSAGQQHEHQSEELMSSSARSRAVLQVHVPRKVVGVHGDFVIDVHEEADECEILEICALVQDQRDLTDEQGDRMVDYVRDAEQLTVQDQKEHSGLVTSNWGFSA